MTTIVSSFATKGYDQPIERLKAWKKMRIPQATYPVSAFTIFLPPEDTPLGQPWYVIEPRISKFGKFTTCNCFYESL
jgi:hypothetical protein